jgi:hypothetical protein
MRVRSASKLVKAEDAFALIEEHRDLILERLHAVEVASAKFRETIASSALPEKGVLPIRPITVFKPVGGTASSSNDSPTRFRALNSNASRLAAAEAFSQLEYTHDDERNRSTKCFGIVGAPGYVLDEAKRLNHYKDELKAAIQPISNLRIQVKEPTRYGEPSRRFREVSTVMLTQTGRSSTNLLAVYRHIPIIEEPVHAIRFMLTRTRSVPRVSLADVRAKAGDRPDLLDILDNTPGLHDDEFLLAPKQRYERMRAKIFLQQLESPHSRRRIQQIVSAELPILFPMLKEDSRWPDVKAPGLPSRHRGSQRSRMEDLPLVTIGAQAFYRLKAEFR